MIDQTKVILNNDISHCSVGVYNKTRSLLDFTIRDSYYVYSFLFGSFYLDGSYAKISL